MTARIEQEDAEIYHSRIDHVSRGMIGTFLDRRRLFEQDYVIGRKAERPPTGCMKKGTATHAVFLEGKSVEECFTIIPASALNADGHKKGANWTAFKALHSETELLLPSEKEQVLGAVQSMLAHPHVSQWAQQVSRREASVYWTCPLTGLDLRCRPDWIIELPEKILDIHLKTSADASREGMRRQMPAYAFEAVHYSHGCRAAFNKPVESLFVVVDSVRPHTTFIHDIKPKTWTIAERLWRSAAVELAKCFRSGDWSDLDEGGVIEWDLSERDFKELACV